MRTSISIVDNVSGNVPFVLRGDFTESIKIASQLGYDAVEMHIRDPRKIEPDRILEACNKEKIEVSSIGTGLSFSGTPLNFMSKDKEDRSKVLQRMKEYIKLAGNFNSIVIIGLLKGNIPPGGDYSTYNQRVTQMLEMCLEDAEINNVALVIEAINRYESNFLNNISETIEFVKKFSSEHIKVHIDTFHMNIEESKIAESIIKCRGVLGHVHFADNNRMYPGHGHIKFEEVIDALKKIDYKGYVAVECLALPDPLEVAKRSLEYINRCRRCYV